MKSLKRKLVAAATMAVALVVLALPSAALAASHSPKGEYAQFSECPLNRVTITDCIFSVSNGGEFTIGKKTVPLVNPVTLQGGAEGAGEEVSFYGAENGDTLSKTPQPVPGGLLGITAPSWWPTILKDLFNETINNGFTGVTATVELAAPASSIQISVASLFFEQGTALSLPVKIKLSNPFLGSNCYVGSNSNPITLALTTGTTAPPPP